MLWVAKADEGQWWQRAYENILEMWNVLSNFSSTEY